MLNSGGELLRERRSKGKWAGGGKESTFCLTWYMRRPPASYFGVEKAIWGRTLAWLHINLLKLQKNPSPTPPHCRESSMWIKVMGPVHSDMLEDGCWRCPSLPGAILSPQKGKTNPWQAQGWLLAVWWSVTSCTGHSQFLRNSFSIRVSEF